MSYRIIVSLVLFLGMASSLECRAVGTVAAERLQELIELLIGLSGQLPEPMEQREVVMQAPAGGGGGDTMVAGGGWKPDLRLQHDLAPSSNGGSVCGSVDDIDR